jgi:uncharacterized phage protein (predicted DNA packaging)
MAIVDLPDVKAHLNIVDDEDDSLIEGKIEAAQSLIEQQLGYIIADEFETVPADLKEAVRQLAAHFYENREATLVGVSASLLPLGVKDIVRDRRNWSWS